MPMVSLHDVGKIIATTEKGEGVQLYPKPNKPEPMSKSKNNVISTESFEILLEFLRSTN